MSVLLESAENADEGRVAGSSSCRRRFPRAGVMKGVLALAALLATASPAAAAPATFTPVFCDRLRQLVEAAHARPAFASLAANPALMRRLAPGCTLSGSGEFRRLTCQWRSAPTSDGWFRLNDSIVACYPQAIRMAEPVDGPRNALFRFGLIAIHTRQWDIGHRGGSFISYAIFRVPVH